MKFSRPLTLLIDKLPQAEKHGLSIWLQENPKSPDELEYVLYDVLFTRKDPRGKPIESLAIYLSQNYIEHLNCLLDNPRQGAPRVGAVEQTEEEVKEQLRKKGIIS